MPDRLFQQIYDNLAHKVLIEVKYSLFVDKMLSYHSDSLEEELAQAFNSGGDKGFKADFFEGYKILHSDKNLKLFQEKFGLKSSLFDILVLEKKWKRIQEKSDLEKWTAGCYYSADDFKDFNHPVLDFKTFGMAIESPENLEPYEHESLHAIKKIYSKNYFLNDWEHKIYEKEEMRMKVEYEILDELLCEMVTGKNKKEIIDNLKERYMFSERKFIYDYLNYNKKQKKIVWRWLDPVTKSIDEVVRAADWIHGFLGPRMMVPLFFSLGSTIFEIKRNEFHSPFNDVLELREFLEESLIRNVRRNWIKDVLSKKGFRDKTEHLNK